jgi:DNA-binding CsgD family transcriptional regulator
MAMSVDLDRVIHALYEAALDPERWVSAFELLGDALGGCAIGSSVQRSAGWMNFLTYARLDPHYMALMGQQFYDVRTNEMVAVMSGLPAAVAVGRQAVKADGVYFRSSLYNEILAPQGVAHAAVACAFRSPEYFVPLGIFRRTGQEEFGQREHDILKRVLPHLQRAMQIGLRMGLLEARQAASDELLDRLPFGVMLLDATGAICRMNAAAQAIVAANDGLSVRQRRLHAASSVEDVTLRHLIASALSLSAEAPAKPLATLAVSRPSMAQPLLLFAVPSPASELMGTVAPGGAIVFVSDPTRQMTPSQTALMELFGMTPTEAKLASLLAGGEKLEDAARRMAITAGTARVHVKNIFRKANVGRQGDLIRLILNNAVVLEQKAAPTG